MNEYVLLSIVGVLILAVLGILLKLLIPRLGQPRRESSRFQRSTKASSDFSVDSDYRKPENTVDDLKHHSSNLEPTRRESSPFQRPAKTASDFSVDSDYRKPENTVDDLKHHSSNLEPLLQDLIDEIRGIRESLNHITETLQSQAVSQPQDIKIHSQEKEKDPISPQNSEVSDQLSESATSEQMSPTLVDFCNLYNENKREELQTRYARIGRVGTNNTQQRLQNPNLPPLFEDKENGAFLVFYIENDDFYAVVPNFGKILDRGLYVLGALGNLFECPNFDPQYLYDFDLVLPARFEPGRTEGTWTLLEQGKLELEIRR